jgi:perosamine synthetase
MRNSTYSPFNTISKGIKMHKVIRSSRPVFNSEDISALLGEIGELLENGQFRFGKNVKIFEDLLANYLGVDGSVAFDSDSSAYETALHYFGAKDKEVVVCTNSFISVPNSVLSVGGRPVFADIKAETLSMDHESLRRNISPRTSGVVVTDISGFPNPDLSEIRELCKQNNLFLIEDATHAIGASLNGKKSGSFGDAGVFSFTPTKVITSGEGGMLVSDNLELCEFAKQYSFYGSGLGKTNFVNLGRHMILPEVSAIMGIYQLRRLEEFVSKRNTIAQRYDAAFSNSDIFQVVKAPKGSVCSYYKYPLILNPKINKSYFTRRLFDEFGVETGNIFYPPCHMQKLYLDIGAFSYGSLAVAEQVLVRTITLPMHVALTDEEVEYVIEKVKLIANEESY